MESLELRANTCCDLISAYAITNPKAVAVAEGYRQLTYGELEGRANQLAQLLRERGVSPDAVVGLCIRRSQEFIIAALGILKAGAAYLPLDPDYPANRLSILLSDSGAGLVVTHSSAAQQVPSGTWQTIIFDPSGTVTASYPRTAPDVKTGPDNLAYVIYTSGSTGRPKG
ncbi:MAG: AMP-binding protein, partial [Candidatus Sulfotelmatobacter sp.]